MSEALDAFPTEAKTRERELRKAQKAAGKAHVVKPRVKEVEEHYDVCGEDLSSLIGNDQSFYTMWTDTLDEEVEQLMHPDDGQDMCSGIEQCMLYGVVVSPANMQTLKTAVLTNLDEFAYVCCSQPPFIKLAEICGGEARTSRLVARWKMKHGPNFDLVVGVGLREPSHQQRVHRYFSKTTAPVCTPCGPWAT